MATTIKLYYADRNSTYKEWELIPNRLLVVEDIASYLAGKSALTFSNIQYVKNELEIGVNLDLSQSYSQPKATTSFKYVSIQNPDELVHYYFVKKIVWRSKSAIRLELVLDVLNTFQEGYDYEFKANTRIIREHKDRLYRATFTLALKADASAWTGSVDEDDEIHLRSTLDGNDAFTGIYKGLDATRKYVQFKAPTKYSEIKSWFASLSTQFFIYKNASNYIQMTGNPTITAISDETFVRKIDPISEGINPILLHASNAGLKIENQKAILRQNWYLLYRNQNDPSESLVNPVDCYLIPENATDTDAGYISNGRIVPSWLEDNKYYYFLVNPLTNDFTLSNGVVINDLPQARAGTTRTTLIAVLTKSGNRINVLVVELSFLGGTPNQYYCEAIGQYDDVKYIDVSSVPVNYAKDDYFLDTLYSTYNSIAFSETFSNSDTYNALDPIENLDRTDAKNIKLIKLPYCPYDFDVTLTYIEVAGEANWEYASIGDTFHALRLTNSNVKLSSHLEMPANLSPYSNLVFSMANPPSVANLRKPFSNNVADMPESKLLHSDFFQETYFYDSFSFKVDLEKCQISHYEDASEDHLKEKITFDTTSTINSKFMFTFANYVCDKAETNFHNVLPIARNNEEVLYNVPYINYVRTGYNYDVKGKNLQNASNIVGLGLGIASVGASLLAPSIPLKVAGVVASLVSVATSVKNTIVTTINNENSIKQKVQQTQNQASSVVGSDDVDLMSAYSGNRLQNLTYRPNETMRRLLNDLFFYAGYASNRMGLPNHHTRVNFDYLECEAQIEAIASIPDECLTELVNCFRSGVTYLHKTDRFTYKWDFEQDFENWELDLLED